MPDHRCFDRREALLTLAAGAAALPALSRPAGAAETCGLTAQELPDVVLLDHEGRKQRFRSDLLRTRTVLVHFTSEAREASAPAAAAICCC
jgi:hypothetical protein